jgi:hypothetical protein
MEYVVLEPETKENFINGKQYISLQLTFIKLYKLKMMFISFIINYVLFFMI